jgi:hypothetical protein
VAHRELCEGTAAHCGNRPYYLGETLPNELVQSRRLPDGLVEATLDGHKGPVLFLIEINTFSYRETVKQLLDDVILTYSNRGVVPEAIDVTLHDRGNVRVASDIRVGSPLGHTSLSAGWRVVNLWELNATDFLPLTDPGLAPWVPLMKIDGPPDPVIQLCKDLIDRTTSGNRRDNLLGVTQVLASLRWDKELVKRLFAKEEGMIESPLLQEWLQEREVKVRQSVILESLEARFGIPVPQDVSAAVRLVQEEARLKELHRAAITSPSLEAFRKALTPTQSPPTSAN